MHWYYEHKLSAGERKEMSFLVLGLKIGWAETGALRLCEGLWILYRGGGV